MESVKEEIVAFRESMLIHNGTQVACLSPQGSADVHASSDALYQAVRSLGERYGAVLLRGFESVGVNGFSRFSSGFGVPVTAYEFGSTPRSKIESSVFSSTEYPASQWIDQHNEQSYTLSWPSWLWFYCDIAAAGGGETPITDSRLVFERIDHRIRQRFMDHGLIYVRNFGNGLDVPWQQVFGTEDHAEVARYCQENKIEFEWLDDGESLRTRQLCQAVHRHPKTGEWVWFNQAHIFHPSNLPIDVREALLEVVDSDRLPRNVLFGDGSPIDDELLAAVREVYRESMFCFPWQQGDILALDNVLMSHGRAPFSGKRRVLVAMTE